MHRRASIVWGCLVLVCSISGDPVVKGVTDDIPLPNPHPESARKSLSTDKAVVKDIVYGLEEDGQHLFLTSQSLKGADRPMKREELKFVIPDGAHIAELSLAKLDGKNLMAVIKVTRGQEYEFHCLTFIAPWGGHVRDRYGFHQAKFFTTPENLKILAIGGKHYSGSAFIVLGEMDQAEDEADETKSITKGVIYFSGCPWPPSDGELSHFRSVPMNGPPK